MIQKAIALDSDQIILDLEDSVIPDEKSKARDNLSNILPHLRTDKKLSIRINELDSDFFEEDVQLINSLDLNTKFTVTLPKIHSRDLLDKWDSLITNKSTFEVQIESADGLVRAAEIASHSRVQSLAFGPADFMASLGMPATEPGTPLGEAASALQWPLFQIVIAAHAFGKLAYDGPYFHIGDDSGLREASSTARALGADGKWVIHPSQIDVCNAAFTPSQDEIHRAQEVITAFDSSTGAVKLNGLMIDEASRKVAERLLERAIQIHK